MIPLEQAQLAIQQGNRARAREILANLVKTAPQNSNAWLLLAEVLDNPQQASYCREKAQTILKNQAQQNFSPSSVMSTRNSGNSKIQAKCPFCAELIPSDAVVCPYCKRNLSNQVTSTTNSPQRLPPMDIPTKSKEGKGSKVLRIILLTLIGIAIICGLMIILASQVTP